MLSLGQPGEPSFVFTSPTAVTCFLDKQVTWTDVDPVALPLKRSVTVHADGDGVECPSMPYYGRWAADILALKLNVLYTAMLSQTTEGIAPLADAFIAGARGLGVKGALRMGMGMQAVAFGMGWSTGWSKGRLQVHGWAWHDNTRQRRIEQHKRAWLVGCPVPSASVKCPVNPWRYWVQGCRRTGCQGHEVGDEWGRGRAPLGLVQGMQREAAGGKGDAQMAPGRFAMIWVAALFARQREGWVEV